VKSIESRPGNFVAFAFRASKHACSDRSNLRFDNRLIGLPSSMSGLRRAKA
jgi:hypothetical protein